MINSRISFHLFPRGGARACVRTFIVCFRALKKFSPPMCNTHCVYIYLYLIGSTGWNQWGEYFTKKTRNIVWVAFMITNSKSLSNKNKINIAMYFTTTSTPTLLFIFRITSHVSCFSSSVDLLVIHLRFCLNWLNVLEP